MPAVQAAPPRDFAARAVRAIDGNATLVVVALIGLHLLLAAATFQPAPHTGGDNAAYIALARSLLERHDYTSLWDPALPPHTQYPPGFPAVLAFAMAVGLGPWVPLKLVTTAFSAAAVALSFLWIRRRGRPLLALGVGTLVALSPGALIESHWILSDVPFWALTMLALWAFERIEPGLRPRMAVAAIAVTLAYFTRSAGLPLALAAAGWLAMERRWRQLALLAAVLLPLALMWWLRARAAGGVDYVGQFWMVDPYTPAAGRIGVAELGARMIENAGRYLTQHLPILLAGSTGGAATLAALLVTALAVGGWTLCVVRHFSKPVEAGAGRAPLGVVEFFLPLYLGLLLVWPAVWSSERFLLPALPVILFYAGIALAAATGALRRDAVAWAGAAAIVVVALLALPQLAEAARISRICMAEYRSGDVYPCLGPEWTDFIDVAETARDALPADAVVLSRKPRLFFVIADRRGRVYPFTDDAQRFFEEVEASGARYVVLDRLGRQAQAYLAPVLIARTERFCVMYAEPATGTAMLGIKEATVARPDSAGTAFPFCGPELWSSPDVRDRVLREMSAGSAAQPAP